MARGHYFLKWDEIFLTRSGSLVLNAARTAPARVSWHRVLATAPVGHSVHRSADWVVGRSGLARRRAHRARCAPHHHEVADLAQDAGCVWQRGREHRNLQVVGAAAVSAKYQYFISFSVVHLI